MKFIGIDLGWSSGASGLCCLNWENNRLELIECDRQQSLSDILTWLDTQISPTEPAIIAVDAPTIVANLTGMRDADKLTHKHLRLLPRRLLSRQPFSPLRPKNSRIRPLFGSPRICPFTDNRS